MFFRRIRPAALLLAAVAAISACTQRSNHHGAPSAEQAARLATVMDQAALTAMTPDEALSRLQAGNARFAAGHSLQRDLIAQQQAAARGQYPFAAVLSCLDSRSAPELIFDQGIGDLFVARVAGNYANADIIGSMEFAAKVSGAKLIVVVGHNDCGAIKGACDNVEMGNLTTVMNAIRPSVADVTGVPGERNSKNKAFVQAVAIDNVRRTVMEMRHKSPILAEMEAEGKIKIVGAMYDLATGQVTFFPWSAR